MMTNIINLTSTIMNTASIAVIIPYYNGSKTIERALKSVFTQTIAAFECIVVNDGSKPDERQALELLQQNYSFTIIDQTNQGQSSARNTGVAATKADYICFLDQDDFYFPEHNEVLLNIVPEQKARFGFVYANISEADGEGHIIDTHMLRSQKGTHPKFGPIINLLKLNLFILPSATLIAKKAYETVGGFDPQFIGYEDDDLFIRLIRAGFDHNYIDHPVTAWCVSSQSTSQNRIKMGRSCFKFFQKLIRLFPDDLIGHHYYFRDGLLNRFGKEFIADVINLTILHSIDKKHHQEVHQRLNDYATLVYQNASIGLFYKIKLWLMIMILKMLPRAPKLFTQPLRRIHRLPWLRRLIGIT